MFKTKEQVMTALTQLPAGEARRRFLAETNASDFLMTIGSNVTLYCGEVRYGKTIAEQLADVSVLVIHRRGKDGKSDGIGALGGLSELIDTETFKRLPEEQQRLLIGVKDNVVLRDDCPVIIDDVKQISVNNVKREVREELGNIGIYAVLLPWDKMKKLPFSSIDADYLVNRWKPGQDVKVVRPQCFALKISSQQADNLVAKSNQGIREDDTELFGIEKMPLLEAMQRIGQSRDKDYRYPHEWIGTWFIAAQLLKGERVQNELIESLQSVTRFEQACYQMKFQNLHPRCHFFRLDRNR